MKYRPELDGIRALAVLGVIMAHTQSGLPGGGRGVDVFFVLSGYLITTLLLAKPSYDEFIARRARRLLPALLVFVSVWLLSGPVTLWRLLQAVISASYNENWLQAFAHHSNGLTHTWSLVVDR